MLSKYLTKHIFGFMFLMLSSSVLSNTEFTYNVIDGGIEVTGCVETCPSDLVIPEEIDGNSVISIAEAAFRDKDINSVITPNTLISIGREAFMSNKLSDVFIGNNVTNIGTDSFRNNDLINVDIPNSVTYIGGGAFKFNKLTSIVIPESITRIEVWTFADNQLTNVDIPQNVTSINGEAFENNQISILTLPEGLKNIKEGAFENNQLSSLSLPESLENIEARAFAKNLFSTISVPNSISNLSRDAFSGNIGVISGEWRYIERLGDAMLLGCADNCPSDMIIPDYIDGFHVQSIDDEAFSEEGLNSIRFPDGIVHLGQNAFLGNPLTIVTYCRSDNSDWDFGDVEGITPQLDESCGISNDVNENITYAALDVDQNGSFDALTDGLILLRYAFGLRGESLIDSVIDSNANRTNAEDIEAHIQSLVP